MSISYLNTYPNDEIKDNEILLVITDGEMSLHPNFQRILSKHEKIHMSYNTIDKFRATKIPSYRISEDNKIGILSCKKRRYNQFKYSEIKDGLEKILYEVISKLDNVKSVYLYSDAVVDDKLVMKEYEKSIKKAFRMANNLKSEEYDIFIITTR